MFGFSPPLEDRRLRTLGIVLVVPVVGITLSELAIFYGYTQVALGGYLGILLLTALTPVKLEGEIELAAVLTLIPLFRLVSLGMPVFDTDPLYWLVLVYGSLLPACYLISRVVEYGPGDQEPSASTDSPERAEEAEFAPLDAETPSGLSERGDPERLPDGPRSQSGGEAKSDGGEVTTPNGQGDGESETVGLVTRLTALPTNWLLGVLLFLPGLVLTVALAETEYLLIAPEPLVEAWNVSEVLVLSVVLVGLVGPVEELIFRGLLQRTLQRRLGRWQGLLLASFLFGLTYSVYGVPGEMLLGGVIGLVFGRLFDLSENLTLVSVLHGVLNVLLFIVIPLQGSILIG